MEQNDKHIEEIDRYLSGEMSEFELGLFELRLKSDSELQERVESLRLTIEVAKQFRAHELKNYIEKHAPEIRKNNFWQTVILYSAAASLILVSISYGLLIYFDKPGTQSVFDFKTNTPNRSKINPNTEYGSSNKSDGTTEMNPSIDHTIEQKTMSDSISVQPFDIAKDQDKMTEDEEIKNLEAPAAGESDISTDQYKIQSDILLLDTNFTIYAVLENKPNNYADKSSNNNYKKEKLIRPSNVPKMNDQESSKQSNTAEYEYRPTQVLNVEFWKSPVNYKGYRYNTKKLIVFGFKANEIKILNIKDILYIKSNGQYYKVEENDRYNNFWPESTPPISE